jgi:hypothetical protein
MFLNITRETVYGLKKCPAGGGAPEVPQVLSRLPLDSERVPLLIVGTAGQLVPRATEPEMPGGLSVYVDESLPPIFANFISGALYDHLLAARALNLADPAVGSCPRVLPH